MLKKKRALIVATVACFFVHMRTVQKVLDELGYEVEVATSFAGYSTDGFSSYKALHDISFSRSPFKSSNIRAYRQLKELLHRESYDLVWCNTPVGGVLGRLAARGARKRGTLTLYMAHGFHFYDGAPLKNWIIYYPVEWICSWFTDVLITITKEDYARASKFFHACKTCYVPGVGVNLERFENTDGDSVFEELGIPEECKVILSVGEINHNKNQQIIIRSLAFLGESVHYIVAGGGNSGRLEELAYQLGVEDQLHLLGHRNDISRLMAASDVFVLPSLREGLNVSTMEAMASGLPCVCRKTRGNVDLIDDEVGGVLVNEETPEAWSNAIVRALALNRSTVRAHNQAKVKCFSTLAVQSALEAALTAH